MDFGCVAEAHQAMLENRHSGKIAIRVGAEDDNAEVSLIVAGALKPRYREALGDLLTEVTVPNGHNLLWESREETIGAVERFMASSAFARAASDRPGDARID